MSFPERIVNSSKTRRSRVVLALDLVGQDERSLETRAKILVEELSPHIAAVKLNFHLLLPLSLSSLKRIVKICGDMSLVTIADMKLNDIDFTSLVATSLLWKSGFDAVIANPIAGYEGGLQESIAEGHRLGKGFLFLVYMSHPGANTFYGLTVGKDLKLFELFAEKAKEWGGDGLVVGATHPDTISKVRKSFPGTLIFAPGVGAQGGKGGEALQAGADFIIVGRSIINAQNPLNSARRICQETWTPWKAF